MQRMNGCDGSTHQRVASLILESLVRLLSLNIRSFPPCIAAVLCFVDLPSLSEIPQFYLKKNGRGPWRGLASNKSHFVLIILKLNDKTDKFKNQVWEFKYQLCHLPSMRASVLLNCLVSSSVK